MKNINENNYTRCNLAEWNDYDDYNNRLYPLNIIPKDKMKEVLVEERIQRQGYDGPYVEVKQQLLPEFGDPSYVRAESHMNFILSNGVHFISLFKEKGVNLQNAWVFLDPKYVEELEKFPYKHRMDFVAYGDMYRLPNNDTFYLQKVEHFEGWRVLLKWDIDGIEGKRPEVPERIIQVTM